MVSNQSSDLALTILEIGVLSLPLWLAVARYVFPDEESKQISGEDEDYQRYMYRTVIATLFALYAAVLCSLYTLVQPGMSLFLYASISSVTFFILGSALLLGNTILPNAWGYEKKSKFITGSLLRMMAVITLLALGIKYVLVPYINPIV